LRTLAQSPVFGGRLKSVDDVAARPSRAFARLFALMTPSQSSPIHMWAAKKGLAALKVEWEAGPQREAADDIRAASSNRQTLKSGAGGSDIGDVGKAMAVRRPYQGESTYQVPFLAHATMEPMNCTAHLRKDECEIWIGTRRFCSRPGDGGESGWLPPEKVLSIIISSARLWPPWKPMAQFALLRLPGRSMARSRSVDARGGHPARHCTALIGTTGISAGLDAQGKPVAWSNRSPLLVIARWLHRPTRTAWILTRQRGAIDLVYDLPNFHVEFVRVEPPGIPPRFAARPVALFMPTQSSDAWRRGNEQRTR